MAQSPAIGPGNSTQATQAPIESTHALAKLSLMRDKRELRLPFLSVIEYLFRGILYRFDATNLKS